MTLTGLHMLLTYACTYECDHCFVWSGPEQPGTFTLDGLEEVLRQARDLGTIEWIYFEGGEPFLYYTLLRFGVRRASELGFRVGIVTNSYWAVDRAAAREGLADLAGRVHDLSVSCDLYHGDEEQELRVGHVRNAAAELGIPTGVIGIAQPDGVGAARPVGKPPPGESTLMYRGRAAEKLAGRARLSPAAAFTSCPYEDLREPGRVHVDPFGHVHVCQGITIGNLFRMPLREICADYDPESHPIVGPLLEGGPFALATRGGHPLAAGYADACHLCDATRRRLRARMPDLLAPDQMYGPLVLDGTAR
jgi:hypothetical protein